MTKKTPRPFLLKLVSVGNKIESIQLFIGIFCVVSFFVFVALDVFARTIVYPIIWAQEVAIFSYIWAVFMGSGIAIRKDTHFKIDFLLNMLPSMKIAFEVANLALTAVFVYLLIGPGLDFALMGIKRLSNPSGIPLIVPSIAIPICGLFFLYFIVERFACALARWELVEVKKYLEETADGSES
jgi:TRAP-type C4-dicarboxylate transport system permease small subunit